MLFGLMRRAEPLRDVFDRERGIVVVELIDEALGYEEIIAAIASDGDLSASELRDGALAAREQILRAAAIEENSLRDILKKTGKSYNEEHWDAPGWLNNLSMLAAVIVIFALPIFSGIATWLLVYDLTSSKWSASVLAVLAAGLVIGAFFVAGKSISDKYLDFPIFSIGVLSSGYVVFVATGRGQSSWAAAAVCAVALYMIASLGSEMLESKEQLDERERG